MKLRSAIITSLAALALAGASPVAAATPDNTTKEHKATTASFKPTPDGRDLSVTLSNGQSFEKHGDQIAVVNADKTVAETLPAVAVDKAGNKIGFHYTLKNNKQITVTPTDEHGFVNYGWWQDWGKCVAGISGGAISAGTTAGLSAAAVGLAGGPFGAGAGLIGGAAVGGIGGGLTGAAAAC